MIDEWWFWGILLVVILAVIIFEAVSRIPKGYEDENGFHYGDPPEDK